SSPKARFDHLANMPGGLAPAESTHLTPAEGATPAPAGATRSAASWIGPSRSGMWEGAPESPPSFRPGGRRDDEGGPGDTPASVAWLRAGRGTGYATDGRTIDPESGVALPPPRRTDKLGRPNQWDPPPQPGAHSSVARVELEPEPQPLG